MPLSRNNEDFAKLFFGKNGHPENMGLISSDTSLFCSELILFCSALFKISSEIKNFCSEVFAHIPISPYFCSEKKRNNP